MSNAGYAVAPGYNQSYINVFYWFTADNTVASGPNNIFTNNGLLPSPVSCPDEKIFAIINNKVYTSSYSSNDSTYPIISLGN